MIPNLCINDPYPYLRIKLEDTELLDSTDFAGKARISSTANPAVGTSSFI
jgi:hypothetical protein